MLLLYIDDDLEDIELFHDAIEIIDSATRCIVARNGKEAMEILQKIVPDCVFLDINMPVMDGKETLRNIRKDKRLQSIPVYILSTSKDRYEAEICMALGANEFVSKPASFKELVRKLRHILEAPVNQSR